MKKGSLLGFAIILAAIGFGFYSIQGSATPYVPIAEAKANVGKRYQVSGKLVENSVRPLGGSAFEFTLHDGKGESITVVYQKIKPNNFEQAVEIVPYGHYDGRKFQADHLLVKCPSKYQGEDAEQASARSY